MADEFKIKSPCTILIAGPTGSGKSSLVKEIIQNLKGVFENPPKKIIFCYDRDQALYDEIVRYASVPIEFVKGLPEKLKPTPRSLLILDDLQDQNAFQISAWFTKNSHHYDCDVIFLTQNLFLKGAHYRTISLNTHILILFKNPRDSFQVMSLARQLKPKNTKFVLDAYNCATKLPHGYIVIDLKQQTPDSQRYRDNILPLKATYFVDKKDYDVFNVDSRESTTE